LTRARVALEGTVTQEAVTYKTRGTKEASQGVHQGHTGLGLGTLILVLFPEADLSRLGPLLRKLLLLFLLQSVSNTILTPHALASNSPRTPPPSSRPTYPYPAACRRRRRTQTPGQRRQSPNQVRPFNTNSKRDTYVGPFVAGDFPIDCLPMRLDHSNTQILKSGRQLYRVSLTTRTSPRRGRARTGLHFCVPQPSHFVPWAASVSASDAFIHRQGRVKVESKTSQGRVQDESRSSLRRVEVEPESRSSPSRGRARVEVESKASQG